MALSCCLGLPLPRHNGGASINVEVEPELLIDGEEKAGSNDLESADSISKDLINTENISAETVMLYAQRLQMRYSRLRSSSRLKKAVLQVVRFCQRFAPAVDVLVQAGGISGPQIIWGSLRAILIVAESSLLYFQFVTSTIAEMADILSLSVDFEQLYQSEPSVDKATSDVYLTIQGFLSHIQREIQKPSFRRLLKNIRSSFRDEFQDDISNLQRQTQVMRDRVQVAHMKRLDISHSQLQQSMSLAVDNSKILVAHAHRAPVKGNAPGPIQHLVNWLDPVNQDEWLYRAIKRRAHGTCSWLSTNKQYIMWRSSNHNSSPPIMSVYGGPGSGKTVLAATVIESLEMESNREQAMVPVTYHSSSPGNVAQNGTDACATILSQLLCQCEGVSHIVQRAYDSAKKYGRTRRSDRDNLPLLLKEALSSLPLVYCVLDGIDEYSDPVEVAMSYVQIAQSVSSFKLLLFSRPLNCVKKVVGDSLTLHIDTPLIQADIDMYLRQAIEGQPWDHQSRVKAYEMMSSASKGMFLYASLGIQALSKAAVDPRSFGKTLCAPPEGIEGLYTQILARMSLLTPERRHLAWELIRWVCFSERPLTWTELQFALSWDEDQSTYCPDKRPFKEVVLDLCSPLVECRHEKFFAIHYSFKEFIRNSACVGRRSDLPHMPDSLSDAESAHGSIAKRVLASLTHRDVIDQVFIDPSKHPLEDYSTTFWCVHVSQSGDADKHLGKQLAEFMAVPQHRRTWILRYISQHRAALPLQRIVRLLKLARKQTLSPSHGAAITAFSIDDLNDLQQVLLELDHLFQASGAPVSNFEKLMYVRDFVRTCTAMGGVDQAIESFSKALALARASFGDDCLQSAWILNSLGLLYDQQQNVGLAIATQEAALAIQLRHLPRDHFDPVGTVNELGRLYRHLGQYDQSMDCHSRALASLRSVAALPDTDLQVILTLNTMGRCLQKQGFPKRALPLHQRAMAGQRRVLGGGPDHPHAIWTLGDVARCQRDLGLLREAVGTLEEALERRTRVLGRRHADTFWTLNDLGLVHEALGDAARGLELHRTAREGQAELLGPEHPHTRWSDERIDSILAVPC